MQNIEVELRDSQPREKVVRFSCIPASKAMAMAMTVAVLRGKTYFQSKLEEYKSKIIYTQPLVQAPKMLAAGGSIFCWVLSQAFKA